MTHNCWRSTLRMSSSSSDRWLVPTHRQKPKTIARRTEEVAEHEKSCIISSSSQGSVVVITSVHCSGAHRHAIFLWSLDDSLVGQLTITSVDDQSSCLITSVVIRRHSTSVPSLPFAFFLFKLSSRFVCRWNFLFYFRDELAWLLKTILTSETKHKITRRRDLRSLPMNGSSTSTGQARNAGQVLRRILQGAGRCMVRCS